MQHPAVVVGARMVLVGLRGLVADMRQRAAAEGRRWAVVRHTNLGSIWVVDRRCTRVAHTRAGSNRFPDWDGQQMLVAGVRRQVVRILWTGVNSRLLHKTYD